MKNIGFDFSKFLNYEIGVKLNNDQKWNCSNPDGGSQSE